MNQPQYGGWNYGNRGEHNHSQFGGRRDGFRGGYFNSNASINKNISGRGILPTPTTSHQCTRIACQICGLSNHLAPNYYHCYSSRNYHSKSTNLSKCLNYTSPFDKRWIFNSRATNHVTEDSGKLSKCEFYNGEGQITISNGCALPITYTSNTHIVSSYESMKIPGFYLVPNFKKNVISVAQFIDQFNFLFIFTHDSLLVKDQFGKLLVKGKW